MRVRTFSNPTRAARALALDVARTIASNPAAVLGLPTGRTPIPLYQELVALFQRGRVSFSRVSTFNLDEFVGVPARHPHSYRAFMRRHLFAAVNLQPQRIHFLDGEAGDLERECLGYERAIARAGGVDLQLLGLGANGHIGFNEPGPELIARTHRTRLRPATRRANAALFGIRVADVPREALSMGMGTILKARRIVLIATGREKARCVKRLVCGPVTPQLPASFLQLHANAEVWLDRDAASRLSAASSTVPRRPRRSRP
jgi:glucosamine-6-phosphate deaminase